MYSAAYWSLLRDFKNGQQYCIFFKMKLEVLSWLLSYIIIISIISFFFASSLDLQLKKVNFKLQRQIIFRKLLFFLIIWGSDEDRGLYAWGTSTSNKSGKFNGLHGSEVKNVDSDFKQPFVVLTKFPFELNFTLFSNKLVTLLIFERIPWRENALSRLFTENSLSLVILFALYSILPECTTLPHNLQLCFNKTEFAQNKWSVKLIYIINI